MKAKRLGVGLADQVFSSASNIFIVMAVARVSSVNEFGSATLAFTAVTATMGTLRGLLGTQLSLLSSDRASLRTEAKFALASALLIGFAAGGGFVAFGLLQSLPLVVIAVAAATPFVLAQDAGRFYALSALRPKVALLSDGIWCAGSLAAWLFTFTRVGARADAAWYVFCWGFLAAAALAIITVTVRVQPNLNGYLAWLRSWTRHRFRFGAEAALGTAGPLVVLIIAAALVGTRASAALRGASTLIGPLSVVMSAASIALVPELRQEAAPSPRRLWRQLRPLAIGLSLMALSMAAITLATPESWGRALLGESWDVVRPIFPVTTLEYVGLAWLTAARTCLRAQTRSHELMLLGVGFTLSSTLGSSIAGAAFRSALAVAVALAVSAWGGALCARVVLLGRGSPADAKHVESTTEAATRGY